MPSEIKIQLVRASAAPADRDWEPGIVVDKGNTQPFQVRRVWSGPAGHYSEQWSLTRDKRAVHTSDPSLIFVRGMQATSEYVDLVSEPISLEPGEYELAFVVEGRLMGTTSVTARPR